MDIEKIKFNGTLYKSYHTIVPGLVRAVRLGKIPGTVYIESVERPAGFGSAGSVDASCLVKACGECGGRGTLDVLGGDWGKTPDSERTCWQCGGTGIHKEA